MSRHLIFILSLFASISLSACTSCQPKAQVCDLATKYSDTAAAQLGATLGCKNTAAIAASFKGELDKLNLCAEAPKVSGPIANVVCQPIAAFVASLAPKAIPAAWGCDGGVALDMGEKALLDVCLKAPY